METTIYLDPGHKRKGIGKQLMDRLISLCREAGYHALVACITASNQESREFHARLGFSEASHFKEVGYKLGEWHDVVDYQEMAFSILASYTFVKNKGLFYTNP